MTSPVSAVEAIEKTMEGVTPGPWTFWVDTDEGGREYAATVLGPNINNGGYPVVADIPPRTMHGSHAANAAYIAACSPDRIREVLALARKAEALERRLTSIVDIFSQGGWVASIQDCRPPRSGIENPLKHARSITLTGAYSTEEEALSAARAQIISGWANGNIIIHADTATPSASFLLSRTGLDAASRALLGGSDAE